MAFEDWWNEEFVGDDRPAQLRKAVSIDYYTLHKLLEEAYYAGREEGLDEG